jgi:hypothetical protein
MRYLGADPSRPADRVEGAVMRALADHVNHLLDTLNA